MRHAAINDVRFPDALLERIQTGVHFRQHAFGDGAFLNHPLDVLTRDGGQMAALASRIPLMSVIITSFSARNAPATAPATRSALML